VKLGLSCTTALSDVDRKPLHRVELSVSDYGRGFDPATIQLGRRGLSVFRERASTTGTDLPVESQPDRGT
jgi:nitrate/nitrite-specific signal transduction histidine kinase